MSSTFSGSASLPSSVLGGESLNWYSDQESPLLYSHRTSDQEVPVRWPPPLQRQHRRLQQRRLGHWRTQPVRHDYYRAVKSHLDLPDESDGYSTAAAAAATAAAAEALRRLAVGGSGAGGTSSETEADSGARRIVVRLPPILLHSPGGKELDTDTSYQQSIREWKAREQLGLPPMRGSDEWRLPHAAVPARPDFSRRVPTQPQAGGAAAAAITLRERRARASASSLTAENISRLQDALAKRAADRLLGTTSAAATTTSEYSAFESELFWLSTGLRRVYMPFVESAPLHDKTCSPADRRAADYEFPGWCYGCRLQQGEHWHGHPSYNPLRDRPVRVGGGFAYVTRELLHSLSGGNWSAAAAAAAMEHLVPKDVAWQRAQLFSSVDDAVIRALASHQQTNIPSRYQKLPDIAAPPTQRESAAVEPASSSVTPLSVVSVGSIGAGRRLSISSDNSGTNESIVGTTSDNESSLAERRAKQRSSLRPAAAAAEERTEQKSSKKTSSRRRSLQDLAIVPLKKHISVIREQTELSVHQENVAQPDEPPAAIGTEAPQMIAAAATSAATVATAAVLSPSQPPVREASTNRTSFVSERSVVVPRPVAERPAAQDTAGGADKYTVRVKLLDGGIGGTQPGAVLLGAVTAEERQRSLEPAIKPTTAAAVSPSHPPPPPPVELDTVTLALVESGESEAPPEEPPPHAHDVAAVDSGDSLPAPSDSTGVSGASPATNDLGDDEAIGAGEVASSSGGDESQPPPRSAPSAKKSAKGTTGSSDSLRKTLTHALQISNWKDPQAMPAETLKVATNVDVAPSVLSDSSTSEVQREEPPKSGRNELSTERAEEVIVLRIGKRQKAPKKTAGGRRGNISSALESAPRTPRPAEERPEKRPEEQRVSPELTHEIAALPNDSEVVVAPSIHESTPPVEVVVASVAESESAVLTPEPADTDASSAKINDTEEVANVDHGGADNPEGRETEPIDQSRAGSKMDAAGSRIVSREPSSIKQTPPGRRAVPGPPKKPNFMHLLTLNVSTEEEEVVASPPRSPTPELDFEIERESPIEEEEEFSQSSTIISQPLPRIRYATSPSPVPMRAVVKEPTPEPREPTPEPIVIRKRPRKALDAFLHNNKGPRLPKRPEVIQPLTKKELQGISDPLDYLSQFCLIRLDRLPYYEKVFREVVAYQQPRFQAAELPATLSGSEPGQAAEKALRPVPEQQPLVRTGQAGIPLATGDATRVTSQTSAVTRPPLNYKLLRSFAKLMSVPEFNEPAINVGEFHVQRITFAMHKQYEKYDRLMQAAELLEAHRDRALADLAKQKHSDILRPKPTGSEADAKAPRPPAKTKASSQLPTVGPRRLAAAGEAAAAPLPKLSDGEVLHRLPPDVMDELLQDAAVRSMTVRLTRLEERIAAAEQRLAQLQEERQEMELWAREVYEAERFPAEALAGLLLPQDDGDVLLQHLHPNEDDEMNLEELEYALRLVNNQLITHRELMYVYHILKIPGRQRINLKTFCCISALSEKVQELDPLIRDLINAFDYEALEIKMQVCKELFYMLADKSGDAIDGAISIRTLAAELIAGGISRENLGYIINKLDFRRKGYIEYLDFLVYIPLFFEIHRRIIANPLSDHRQSYGGFQRHLSQQEQALD